MCAMMLIITGTCIDTRTEKGSVIEMIDIESSYVRTTERTIKRVSREIERKIYVRTCYDD